MPKKGARSMLEVVVPTPLVPMIIPIRHVLAVVTTESATAVLQQVNHVLVVKYVRRANIVARRVPVTATREVSTSSTLS